MEDRRESTIESRCCADMCLLWDRYEQLLFLVKLQSRARMRVSVHTHHLEHKAHTPHPSAQRSKKGALQSSITVIYLHELQRARQRARHNHKRVAKVGEMSKRRPKSARDAASIGCVAQAANIGREQE
jgi:hypothetical protein